jgi:hypothetical protein
MGIVGAWGGLGMVLDAHGRLVFESKTFQRMVVQIDMSQLDGQALERLRVDGETVIL